MDERRCDLYRKGSDGLWVLHPSHGDEAVHLASVDLALPGPDIWADLEDDAGPRAESAAV